jgi:DNA-binding beta-propeller fold protein YncE
VDSQLPYVPANTITLIGDQKLNGPQDIVCDTDNKLLYIADTGNKRIVVSDYEGNLVKIIGEGILSAPQGICLGKESGSIYVADRVEEKVFRFRMDGELITEYTIPQEPLFGKTSSFQPMKVAVDIAENVYVISNGNTNGMIQLSNDGYFLGYFGANKTKTTFLDIIRKRFYSKEQLAKLIKNQPKTPTNLASDSMGLIYTITQGEGNNNNGLKKLNMAGSVIFSNYADPIANDITVSDSGSIYSISQEGYIIEYSRDGDLLFIFGGKEDGTSRVGLFADATGITADENENLYVLDASENVIQVFTISEFKKTLIPAINLYYDGHYEQSKEPWTKVLKNNRLFQYAYVGLGEAEFKLENYEAAMEAYYRGDDKQGYSAAFWEIRNRWLNQYIIYCILGLVGFLTLTRIVKRTNAKYGYLHNVEALLQRFGDMKLCREVRYIGSFIKHPIDGYYGIRFQKKTSILSASMIYLIAFAVYTINRYYSGYIFKTVEEGYYNLLYDLSFVGGTVLFLVICNYLVSTIREGEGSFKVVYMSVAYSLMPYIFIKPILTIFTHVLTLNEVVLLNLGDFIIRFWCLVLILLLISEIHNYSFSNVIKNVLITLATALVMGIILFVIYLMFNQLVDFVYSLVKEVMYRVGY